MDIEDKNGKHIVTLGEGTLIGEIAFFMEGSKRTATVKARTWCDFVTLERGEFDEACEKYPDQQAAIRVRFLPDQATTHRLAGYCLG